MLPLRHQWRHPGTTGGLAGSCGAPATAAARGSSEDDAVTTTSVGGEQGPGVPVQGFGAEHGRAFASAGDGAAGGCSVRVGAHDRYRVPEPSPSSSLTTADLSQHPGCGGQGNARLERCEANTHTHLLARGRIGQKPGKGQEIELKATAIRLRSCPPDNYPLAKGRLPLEFLRNHPHFACGPTRTAL